MEDPSVSWLTENPCKCALPYGTFYSEMGLLHSPGSIPWHSSSIRVWSFPPAPLTYPGILKCGQGYNSLSTWRSCRGPDMYQEHFQFKQKLIQTSIIKEVLVVAPRGVLLQSVPSLDRKGGSISWVGPRPFLCANTWQGPDQRNFP